MPYDAAVDEFARPAAHKALPAVVGAVAGAVARTAASAVGRAALRAGTRYAVGKVAGGKRKKGASSVAKAKRDVSQERRDSHGRWAGGSAPRGVAHVDRMAADEPDPVVRDYLESALWNADRGDERDVAQQLAAMRRHAHGAGHAAALAALDRALAHVGARVHGAPGERRPFDGRYFVCAGPIFTGVESPIVTVDHGQSYR